MNMQPKVILNIEQMTPFQILILPLYQRVKDSIIAPPSIMMTIKQVFTIHNLHNMTHLIIIPLLIIKINKVLIITILLLATVQNLSIIKPTILKVPTQPSIV